MKTKWGSPGLRLKEARKKLQMVHTGTLSAPPALENDLLPGLREKLVEAVRTDDLTRLAQVLTPREVRGLIKGLALWPELTDSILQILLVRDVKGISADLWRSWQFHPHIPALRTLLLAKAEKEEWPFIPTVAFRPTVASWIKAGKPGEAIQAWLDSQGLSYSDLADLASSPLLRDTPLTRLVREAVLSIGSAGQLRAEKPQRLLAWFKELHPAIKAGFGQNYLRKMEPTEWHVPFLEQLKEVFGLPGDPRIASFWERVPEDRKKAFKKHFLKTELKKGFGEDPRYDYWVKWVEMDVVDTIQRGTAGSVTYGVLDFGEFGVIEVFEYGHAAYFYPKNRLKRIIASRPSKPSDLRDRMWRYGGFNRVIHRGYQWNWAARADGMVRRWLKATSER